LIFENENGASDFFFTTDLAQICEKVAKELNRHQNRNNSIKM